MSSFSAPHPELDVRRVDYRLTAHQVALIGLLDHYAQDPMGGAEPLDESVKARLCGDLADRPMARSFIAWTGPEPVGLINCIEGYSTFKARPLLNVHDLIVHRAWRGRGVGQALLGAAEQLARDIGCCKLTLEVLSGNTVAMRSYADFGFAPYQLDASAGQALLLQKWL
jgi:GNAT superfamily N-acetyltransferase